MGHLVLNFADQGIVIELIADADSLTLIECLKQMIQTCIFESRFDACDLVLTSILEFAEQWLDILTLLLGSSSKQSAKEVSFCRLHQPGRLPH